MGAEVQQLHLLPQHLQQDEPEQRAVELHTNSSVSGEPAAAPADSSAWQVLELADSLSAPPAGEMPSGTSAAVDSSSTAGRPLLLEERPQQQEVQQPQQQEQDEGEVSEQEPAHPGCGDERTAALQQDAPVQGDILTGDVAACPDDSSPELLPAAVSNAPQSAAEQELQLGAIQGPQESPHQRQPSQSQLQQQAEQEGHVQPPPAVQDTSHTAHGMQQPEPGMLALHAVQGQDSSFDLGEQGQPSSEQQGAGEGTTPCDSAVGALAEGSTGVAGEPLQATLLGAAASALGTFSMQYNDLFQPASVAPEGIGGLGAQDSAASRSLQGTQAAATAPAPACAAASTQQAAVLVSGGAGGVSRVDEALQKLHSLRTTLRSISSSGGGRAEHSSLRSNIAGASLSGSRTASPPLGSREPSSSMLQLPVQRSSGVLSNEHSAQALTAVGGCHLPVAASCGGGSESGSALASAKDWIRQISQRLQQVSSSTPEGLGPVPGDAAGRESASGLAAEADAGAADACGAVMPSNTAGDANSAVLAAQVAAPDGEDTSMPASRQEVSESGAAGSQQPASPGECCASAGGQQDDVGLMLGGSQPEAAVSVEHQQQQEQTTADSAAWSTLTASTSSSASSVGSQQLPDLQEAQQQASQEQQQGMRGVDQSGAVEQAASSSDGSVAAAPAGVAPTQQQLSTDMPQPAPEQQQWSRQQQQHQQPDGSGLLVAEASSTAVVPQSTAGEAAATMVESEQRLQQLLSCQNEDTMLLTAFALKLDRLGRRFQPHPAEGQGGAALLCLTASPGTAWQTPQPQQRPGPTPGSPGRDDGSPPGLWTSITHNTLFNASPASTPQKVPQGAGCANEAADAAQAGDCVAGAGAAVSPAAASPQAALSAVTDADAAAAAFTVQLQDAVLQSVMGVHLEDLRSGSAQAVDAVACVLAGLGRQLADAAPATMQQPGSSLVQPQLILLKEDLRAELRWQCAQRIAAGGAPGGGGSGSSGAASLAAGLSSLQEHLFERDVLPLVLACVEGRL